MAKYENGFECDKNAKVILKDLIQNNWFSSCTIYFDEENDMDEFARVDIVFTAVTKTDKIGKYAVEIKERKGYNHTDYEEWIIEPHKLNDLKRYKYYGYKPLYFNLYKDGYYYLWDYGSLEKGKTKCLPIKPHTQGDYNEIPVNKERIMINANDCIRSGRINEI